MTAFTEEIAVAVSRLKTKKAPGGDGLLPKTVKVLHNVAPGLLRDVFNLVPQEWKDARVVLLRSLARTLA